MATAMMRAPRMDEIKLETNVAQTFALKYTTGKAVGQWGNIMFTAVDDRRLFLNAEDASEFEHALLDLRYKPADFIRVTRVKHGKARGGGFAIRVELEKDEPQSDRDYTSDLAQSISNAEASRRLQAQRARALQPVVPVVGAQATAQSTDGERVPMSKDLGRALIASIDAAAIAAQYAESKGISIAFTSEDIRCFAVSILTEFWRNGGGR
jgi:hypothetical protein